MWAAFTGEAALLGLRMLCSPWQSVHTGACAIPRAKACPCTLDRYWSATSLWHMPQVSGRAVRNAWDLGSSNSCAPPWHSEQSGVLSLPALRAWPWTPRA